jgi:hypothetical protein
MVLLEVVECWPSRISVRVCLWVEVWWSEGRSVIRCGFGVHADDVFEGFDLVGLRQL